MPFVNSWPAPHHSVVPQVQPNSAEPSLKPAILAEIGRTLQLKHRNAKARVTEMQLLNSIRRPTSAQLSRAVKADEISGRAHSTTASCSTTKILRGCDSVPASSFYRLLFAGRVVNSGGAVGHDQKEVHCDQPDGPLRECMRMATPYSAIKASNDNSAFIKLVCDTRPNLLLE